MTKTKFVGQDPVVAQADPTAQPETAAQADPTAQPETAAQADPTAQPETAALPDPILIKARVLVDCEFGAPNDVVEIDVDMTEALATVVDTDPAAVAYAESLGRK